MESAPPRRTHFGVKLAKVEDFGVVLDEDKVLVVAVFVEDGPEKHPLVKVWYA